ncbi:ARF/SAR superfamily protein [Tilletiaria anomala UBC 951]|uniref:ARF/SAR superfamily protein n=1 Tax=Tilletiaria anomala (strain ATCC 24038 / CBS 436.72 / UBC 951) TaxID=1037660 RepID=A0A066VWK3_TILAU|nr:ARF/SAR superfamily protein [Tilletiaria anomala UBC 951]KDN46117.1 ARF/SAR superfamily protein [Tilletiaria anomala UBC 951]
MWTLTHYYRHAFPTHPPPGKSTVIKKINGEPIDEISPTLGFNIKTFIHKGYTLNIWDVGGQRTLRPYWRNYFERTDAIVWVVDSGDVERMKDCKTELWGLLGEERLAGATILVLANKQDIAGSMTSEQIRQSLALGDIKSHAWRIQPCSAVTGENLLTGLDWMIDNVSSRIYAYGAIEAG